MAFLAFTEVAAGLAAHAVHRLLEDLLSSTDPEIAHFRRALTEYVRELGPSPSHAHSRSGPGLLTKAMADRYFTDPDLAAVYDIANPRPRRDDYNFYLARITSAAAVMDAGCGSGTLLAEAREAGHSGRLCGVDPAEAMLERARSHADIEWVLGDLTIPRWRAEFDLMVMTGHAFQAIVTDNDIAVVGGRRSMTHGA